MFHPFPWIATDAFRVLAMTIGTSFSANYWSVGFLLRL